MAAIETNANVVPFPGVDLAREANHRIANSLSMLVGMVQIQAGAVARGPENLVRGDVKRILDETAGKIISVGHLHRKLADQPHTHEIDLTRYLVESTTALVSSLALEDRLGVVYELGETGPVPAETAQALGLIVSEIIMNAVKHAHPTDIAIRANVCCGHEADGRLFVEVCDDGVGLPEGFDEKKGGGVGFKLIRSLSAKLHADLSIRSDSLGLSFKLILPR